MGTAEITIPQIILSLLLAAALARAAWTDIATRTIANRLNIAIAVAAPLWWWATGLGLWPGVGVQLLIAAVLLLLFGAVFAIGAMGGGDVKLITALGLWFGVREIVELLTVMALAGVVVTLCAVVGHRVARREGRPEVPYGVAIAFAGLWMIGQRYLNQFG